MADYQHHEYILHANIVLFALKRQQLFRQFSNAVALPARAERPLKSAQAGVTGLWKIALRTTIIK